MTEAELLARARRGDRGAIRALYDRHSPRVFSVIRRIVGDDELARDASQEAWLRAIRSLPTFRGEARFSTWIHRIAVNATLASTRKRTARERQEVSCPSTLTARVKTGDVLLADRLEWALSRLPAGMREVLVLHDVEQYTHDEIGEVLGITAGTSKSQLFKARARMRMLLAPKGDTDPRPECRTEPADGRKAARASEPQAGLEAPGHRTQSDRRYEGAEA